MTQITILATDTETNGLKFERHHAIQIAIVMGRKECSKTEYKPELIDRQDFEVFIDWRCLEPNFFISKETTEVHGIREQDLDGAPDPITAYSMCYEFIKNYLGEDSLHIINGFNVTFDLNMIITDLKELVQIIDRENIYTDEAINVRRLLDVFYNQYSSDSGAQLINGKVMQTKKLGTLVIDSIMIDRVFHETDENGVRLRHSLEDCSRRYGMPLDDNAHNALSDTIQTMETFNKQFNELYEMALETGDLNLLPVNKKLEERLMRKYDLVEASFKRAKSRPYNGREEG